MTTRLTIYAFIVVGIGAMLCGAYFTYTTRGFLSRAELVDARVVKVDVLTRRESGTNGTNKTTYRPHFQYLDTLGNTITAPTLGSSSRHNFPIGSTQEIYFDTDHPERLRMNSPFQIWGLAGIFSGLGMLFLVLGLFFQRGMRPRVEARIEPKF